jgi:hypothetical protein
VIVLDQGHDKEKLEDPVRAEDAHFDASLTPAMSPGVVLSVSEICLKQ